MAGASRLRRWPTRGRLTTKGQVTIPKHIRDRLGLQPGDSVDFAVDEEGEVRLVRRPKPAPLDKWIGYLTQQRGKDPDAIVRELRGH